MEPITLTWYLNISSLIPNPKKFVPLVSESAVFASHKTNNLLFVKFATFILAVPPTFKSYILDVVSIETTLATYKLRFIETSLETNNLEFNDKSPALLIVPLKEGADNGAYVVWICVLLKKLVLILESISFFV